MKRITISLPDELATAVEREAKRRRISSSEVTRRALAEQLGVDGLERRRLPFIRIGRSGEANIAERVEEILAREWADNIDCDR